MKWLILTVCAGLLAQSSAGQKPNIIFVLADDLGWSDLGCYGNEFHETPHIDQLADKGIRFTRAYAAAPVCSPYRAAFLTGQHPARLGILDYLRPNSANGLSTQLETLPEALGKNGYLTGMIGKWHLTGYRYHEAEFELRPTDHGFSWNIGSEVKGVGNGANTWPYVFRNQAIPWIDLKENRLGDDEYLTDRLNLEALEFVERSAHTKRPFFLYLSHYAPHTILNGRGDLVEKYRKKHPPGKSGREKCYLCEDAGLGPGDPLHHWAIHHNPHLAAMLESIDDGIGKLTQKLVELGIDQNTIFIFTSDNGGESNVTSNAPLRGGKSELYEGGIRIPLIVRWPSQVKPGTVTDLVTQNTDFYPTLLEAADIQDNTDQEKDGKSMLATWKNPETKIPERDLYWHYPLDQPHFLGGHSMGAIQSGDWKLIEHFDSGTRELYHLTNDPGEQNNRALEKTELLSQLENKLQTWRDSVGAKIPSPPLLTETKQLYFADHFTPGLISERLWYGTDWVAEESILKRLETGKDDSRIFLRDSELKDAVVRFSFRLGDSKDIRLVTGSGGHYNTVVHIRPDHFYIQTALDPSGPWFSYRHGECAFTFDPKRWYSMTVEFLKDEVIAHIDHQHLAYAKHPIIDQTRKYLAFQVDQNEAHFDDFQIFTARSKRGDELEAGRTILSRGTGKHPVDKPLEEQYQIQKKNAHEWYYQRDQTYRSLTDRVASLDQQIKKDFPAASLTHKDIRKKIAEQKKQLLKSDPVYKETLYATHRANRAIDSFLIEQSPGIEKFPNSQKKAKLNQLKAKYSEDRRYRELVKLAESAQAKLVADYPDLFITDDAINRQKKSQFEKSRSNPDYMKGRSERAAAYREQQEYLLEVDTRLAELEKLKKEGKNF